MYLQKIYEDEEDIDIRLSEFKKKYILSLFDFTIYRDHFVNIGKNMNRFISTISKISLHLYNDVDSNDANGKDMIHFYSQDTNVIFIIDKQNYSHPFKHKFEDVIITLIEIYDQFFLRTIPEPIFLKIVLDHNLEDQERFVIIDTKELENIILLIRDYIEDELNNEDDDERYKDYINRIEKIVLYPNDFMLKICLKTYILNYPEISNLVIFKYEDDIGNEGELSFQVVSDYITPLYREKLQEQFNNIQGGTNNKHYYIDKHNKKYNRKIILKDRKKFVRFNSKLIELKEYKEIIERLKKNSKTK